MAKPPHDLKGIASLLAKQGRGGDTMLAHINPQEAELLKSLGGAGTINPETGLPEFWSFNIGPVEFSDDGVDYDPGWGLGVGNITGSGGLLGKAVETARGITGAAAGAVENAAQKLGQTVEAIVSDPKKLAAVGIMIAFPGAAGAVGDFILGDALAVDSLVASGAMTASEAALVGGSTLGSGTAASAIVGQAAINAATNGGNVEQAVKAALIQQGLPAALKSDVMQSLNKDMVDVLGKYGAQATTQAGLAAIMGKDPVAAFVFSGATSAAGLITKEIPGFSNLPEAAQRALTSSVVAGLTGKDASTAAASSLVNSMVRGAQTAFAAAERTGGKAILTGDQIKAVGESQVPPTSGGDIYERQRLDNLIKYAQLMNEGKVLNDPSTLKVVASLWPAGYEQLEKYQMSLVPAQVTAPSVPADEVTAGTQQLIDAITNPQTTVSYPGTQVADLEGKTGVPSDKVTDQDLEQLGVGLPIGDDLIENIINFGSSGLNPLGPVTPAQSEYTGPPLPPGYTPPSNTDLTQDDLINIINGGQDSVSGGEATTQGGATTDTIQSGAVTDTIQGGQDSITGGSTSTPADGQLRTMGPTISRGSDGSYVVNNDWENRYFADTASPTGFVSVNGVPVNSDGTLWVNPNTKNTTDTQTQDTQTGGQDAGTTLTGDDGSTLTINSDGSVSSTDATDLNQSTLTGGSGATDTITGGTTTQPNIEYHADGSYTVTYEDGTSAVFNADGTPYSTKDDTGTNTISVYADDTSPSGFRDSLGNPVNADGSPYVAQTTGTDTLTGGSSTVTGGGSGGSSTVAGGGSGGQPAVPPPTNPVITPGTPSAPAAPSRSGFDLSALLGLLGATQAQQAPTPPPTVDIGEQLDLEEALQTNPFAKKQTQSKMAEGGSIDDLLALLQQRG